MTYELTIDGLAADIASASVEPKHAALQLLQLNTKSIRVTEHFTALLPLLSERPHRATEQAARRLPRPHDRGHA